MPDLARIINMAVCDMPFTFHIQLSLSIDDLCVTRFPSICPIIRQLSGPRNLIGNTHFITLVSAQNIVSYSVHCDKGLPTEQSLFK